MSDSDQLKIASIACGLSDPPSGSVQSRMDAAPPCPLHESAGYGHQLQQLFEADVSKDVQKDNGPC